MRARALRCIGMAVTAFGGPVRRFRYLLGAEQMHMCPHSVVHSAWWTYLLAQAVSAERRFRHPLYVGYLLGA